MTSLVKHQKGKTKADLILNEARAIFKSIQKEQANIVQSKETLREYWAQIAGLAYKYCTHSRPIAGIQQAFQVTDFAKEIGLPTGTIRDHMNEQYLISELGNHYDSKNIGALRVTKKKTVKKDSREVKVKVYLAELQKGKFDRMIGTYVKQLTIIENNISSVIDLDQVNPQEDIRTLTKLASKINKLLNSYLNKKKDFARNEDIVEAEIVQ